MKKALAEGSPSEILIVLGWQIDMRRMLISLPHEKASVWENDLKQLLNNTKAVSAKTLETIQGRNVHITSIIPGATHFQNRMYKAIGRAKCNKYTKMLKSEKEDLQLSLKFLSLAKKGMDINLLVTQ